MSGAMAGTLSAVLFLAAAAPAGAAGKAAAAYTRYAVDGGYFECDLPEDWKIGRDRIADNVEKVYGAEAVGPRTKEGAPVRISVDYYSKENTLFKDGADYLDRNAKEGPVKIKENRYGPVKALAAAGLAGKIFERESSIYLPPGNPMASRVPVKEKVAVLTANEGFYVLRYYAPAALYQKHLPAYDRLLKSFKAGPPAAHRPKPAAR